jgi:hypothetical protein
MEAVINDVLDFVLRFSFYEVRGWPRVVGAMGRVFVIGGEQRGVEDVMYCPGQGKLELISDW